MKYFDSRYRNYNRSEECIIEEGGGAVMLAAEYGGAGTQREINIQASAQCYWQSPAAAASSQQMPHPNIVAGTPHRPYPTNHTLAADPQNAAKPDTLRFCASIFETNIGTPDRSN